MVTTIKKRSIAESAAAHIRDSIITGRIKPGERLKEKELCEELGISRTPLREAFRILQTQELIEYNPYIGISAAALTERYIRETWAVKLLLEPRAAMLAAKNRTDADLERMASVLEEQKILAENAANEFTQIDNRFHHILGVASGNHELCGLIDHIYERTALARSRSVLKNRDIGTSYLEHMQIMKAIEARDEEKAGSLAANHLKTSLEALIEAVS